MLTHIVITKTKTKKNEVNRKQKEKQIQNKEKNTKKRKRRMSVKEKEIDWLIYKYSIYRRKHDDVTTHTHTQYQEEAYMINIINCTKIDNCKVIKEWEKRRRRNENGL